MSGIQIISCCVSVVLIVFFITAKVFYCFGKKVGTGTSLPQKEVVDGDYDIVGEGETETVLGHLVNVITQNGEYLTLFLDDKPKCRKLRFKGGKVICLEI